MTQSPAPPQETEEDAHAPVQIEASTDVGELDVAAGPDRETTAGGQPLAAGQRLGSYEVLSLLGKGGMGEVYLARDTRLDRHVALKVPPEGFTRDPERLARFEREARLLAYKRRLCHAASIS